MGSVRFTPSATRLQVFGLPDPSAPSAGITVMGWYKPASDESRWSAQWSRDDNSTGGYRYLENGGNNASWFIFGESGSPVELFVGEFPKWPVGQWSFVAFRTLDNGNTQAWWKRDGDPGLTQEVESTDMADLKALTHFIVGGTPWGGDEPDGSITALKVWDAALTQTEIEAEMNSRAAVRTADLTAVWYLTGVGDWADQSGNGHDLAGGAGTSTDPDEPNDLVSAPPGEQRTVAVSGGGTVSILETPGGLAAVAVSGGGTVTVLAQGSEAAQRAVAVSGGGTVTVQAQGQEGAQRAVAVSGGGTVTVQAVGQEGAQRVITVSGGGAVTVAAVPGGLRGIAVTGGGTVSVAAVPGYLRAVAVSGGGTVIIDTSAGARRTVGVSGGGTVSILETPGGLAAVAVSGGGVVAVKAFGTEPGQRFVRIRGGGRVTITVGGPFLSPRNKLEQLIRQRVGSEWTVYGWPPENLVVPSIVIRPADPYQAPDQFGATAWAFWVDVTVARTKMEYALTKIEQGMSELRGALEKSEFTWQEVSQPDTPPVASRNYLRAAFGVATVQAD